MLPKTVNIESNDSCFDKHYLLIPPPLGYIKFNRMIHTNHNNYFQGCLLRLNSGSNK